MAPRRGMAAEHREAGLPGPGGSASMAPRRGTGLRVESRSAGVVFRAAEENPDGGGSSSAAVPVAACPGHRRVATTWCLFGFRKAVPVAARPGHRRGRLVGTGGVPKTSPSDPFGVLGIDVGGSLALAGALPPPYPVAARRV